MTRGRFGAITDRTFEAVVFDWDGTAVPDRQADAAPLRARIEALSAAGVHLFIVSGTHVGNVDGQLGTRPPGPGHVFLCLNRGSEVFDVDRSGLALLWRRVATDAEERGLDRAAALALDALRTRGLAARVVSERLNRRKIDIIPEPQWADPPKARIGALLDAVTDRVQRAGMTSLADVVAIARGAARDVGLEDPRITSDVKHVEIGLTDKADSSRWAASWLAERGVTGGLILVGGDEFGVVGGVPGSDSFMVVPELALAAVVSVGIEPGVVPSGVAHLGGGPERFGRLLDRQLARRRARRVPIIDEDPAWVLSLPAAPRMERMAEAIGTLSNGWAGVRATREEGGPDAAPLFVVQGVYTGGEASRLLPGPLWTGLRVGDEGHREHQSLDLRSGVLARGRPGNTGVRSLRFVSAASRHALALRAEGPASHLEPGNGLAAPGDGIGFEQRDCGSAHLARTYDLDNGAGITVAARDWHGTTGRRRVIERLAAWTTANGSVPAWHDALEGLAGVEGAGFDRLLAEHRHEWARRWQDAEVTIEGHTDDQLAARFAVFHLLAAAADAGDAAVGARGLTGPAYGGHVFWDADVFVLPALAAIRPNAARAMLEYRIRRLSAARAAATATGRRGARFPWESAADGSDVTPQYGRGRRGELVPIRTGQHEVHIVADVAWAATEYAAWTGDVAFQAGAGRDLVVETARYWASRAQHDADGRAHLCGVMGPDEYHEVVDDNAFTNVMARWNLQRAADLVERGGGDGIEAAGWRVLAAALVDGHDPATGLYEQFAGYWGLEPLLIEDLATPPVAADVLFGAERVAGSQLIKQADVVMLHHLIPDAVAPGSLGPNLAYYLARTTHGSSLSPAVYAALLARARQPDAALELFRLAARLDLDDLTGTTAGGLHLATMGGVWQALAYGFLGLRPRLHLLDIDPCLPSAWQALGLRLRFEGAPVAVRAERDSVAVACTEPLVLRVAGGDPRRCDPPGAHFVVPGGMS